MARTPNTPRRLPLLRSLGTAVALPGAVWAGAPVKIRGQMFRGVVLLGVLCVCTPAAFANGNTAAPATIAANTPAPATPQAASPAAQSAQADSAATSGSAKPTAAAPAAAALEITNVRWDYKDADFFKRISEYFTNTENTGHRLILRTQPQQRAGLYFQARLSRPAATLPANAAVEVSFARHDAQEATSHRFTIPTDGTDTDKTQLWLGFTGEDTPQDGKPPVAWQIRVLDGDGNALATYSSFLWSSHDNAKSQK